MGASESLIVYEITCEGGGEVWIIKVTHETNYGLYTIDKNLKGGNTIERVFTKRTLIDSGLTTSFLVNNKLANLSVTLAPGLSTAFQYRLMYLGNEIPPIEQPSLSGSLNGSNHRNKGSVPLSSIRRMSSKDKDDRV